MKYNVNDLNRNYKLLHNENAEIGTKIIIAVAFGEFEDAEIKSIKTVESGNKQGNKQIKYVTLKSDHLYTTVLSSLEDIENRLSRAGTKPNSFIA